MLINKLNKMDSAPQTGYMLAYTRKEVLFEPYYSIQEVSERLAAEDVVELHLFDNDREYRAVVTESSRFEGGVIEYIADFKLTEGSAPHKLIGDVYREDCTLEHGEGKLTVFNHIRYENGMIIVDDYRLVMGGVQNG